MSIHLLVFHQTDSSVQVENDPFALQKRGAVINLRSKRSVIIHLQLVPTGFVLMSKQIWFSLICFGCCFLSSSFMDPAKGSHSSCCSCQHDTHVMSREGGAHADPSHTRQVVLISCTQEIVTLHCREIWDKCGRQVSSQPKSAKLFG